MAATPKELVRPEILALSAYHVHDARGMVKLDAMENPYRLSARLRREAGRLAEDAELNRYPDPSGGALKHVLRSAMGIPEDAAILLGNGSDEIIQIIAMGLARSGAAIVAPEPSFVMYRMIATFCGMRYVGVPLRKDFSLDLDATLAAIERERPAVVFIAFPNNPTGNLFPAAALERILTRTSGLVVIDEAYHAFARASFLNRVGEFPNLVVMRTLSKLGLAGLRLGFLVGRPEWLNEFEKLRLPYNVNVLTQAIAARVLEDSAALADQAEMIVRARNELIDSMSALASIRVYPSDANFVLFRAPDGPRVFAALKQRGVLIRNLDGSHPLLANCLRVTVGSADDNDAFLAALRASL